MNHDEKKLNPRAEPDVQPSIEPELEARVVAWVAGEASPFEIAELERIVAEKPELAIFKNRIEAVHGLVAEALQPEKEPLRMADERRAELLQTLGENENVAVGEEISRPERNVSFPRVGRPWSWRAPRLYFIASGLAAACLAVLLFFPRHKMPVPAEVAVVGAARVKLENEAKDREVAVRAAIETQEKRRAESRTMMSASASAPAQAEERNDTPLQVEYPKPLFAGRPSAIGGAAGQLTPSGQLSAQSAAATPSNAPSSGDVQTFADASQLESRLVAQAPASTTAAASPPRDGPIELQAFTVSTPKSSNIGSVARRSERPVGAVSDASAGDRFALASTHERESVAPARAAPPPPPVEETSARSQPVSTFSLHVSDVSFRLAENALGRGVLPDASRIRPEEFYNAFHYGDPAPAMNEKISCAIEQAAHPFLQQRNIVRIAVKVPSTGRAAGKPLRLTVLLDTSGSMEREDRAASVRRAMEVLVSLLGPNDRITLIGFARQPRLLADAVPGNEAGQLLDLIARTPAEGGTNLEAALMLAAEHAYDHRKANAQNRIVLLTDGAANLGDADPEALAKIIDVLRQNGIAFDACGVGLDGLDDAVLEALTRKGDGRYYVLDSPEAADAGFARQLAGAFRPAAENVKVQVRFNPARVGNYRLIGFDQHRLHEEDFRNDQVDAAELAADEAAVALYQVEPLPQGTGELGEVFVRFRDAATGEMVERSWAMSYDAHARAFDRATPSIQLAGTAALLAEKLRGGAPADAIKLRDLAPVVNALRSHYEHQPRVQELATMFAQMRRISGE